MTLCQAVNKVFSSYFHFWSFSHNTVFLFENICTMEGPSGQAYRAESGAIAKVLHGLVIRRYIFTFFSVLTLYL
jgi:hypothetical protein